MKAKALASLSIGAFFVGLLLLSPGLAAKARSQESPFQDGSYSYSRQELAQMLAPIALYPDALLSQVLMASTYPIEVIEAERWRRDNPHLQDASLDRALVEKYWDPSVKALVHFPSVLSLMSDRIGETTTLGHAFLAQEGEVMELIQELRADAYARGNLASNSRQRVVMERETILIQPANPRIIYVPYYDPLTIYGTWRYRSYPPYYWGPSRTRLGVGLFYGPGFSFSFSFGNWSYFDWHRRSIYIDAYHRPRFVHRDHWRSSPGRWQHRSVPRRSVIYRSQPAAHPYRQPLRSIDPRRGKRDAPAAPTVVIPSRSAHERPIPGGVHSRPQRTPFEQNRTIRQQIEIDRQHRETLRETTRQRQKIDTLRQRQEPLRTRQPRTLRSGQQPHAAGSDRRRPQEALEHRPPAAEKVFRGNGERGSERTRRPATPESSRVERRAIRNHNTPMR